MRKKLFAKTGTAETGNPTKGRILTSLLFALAIVLIYLGFLSAYYNGDGVVFALWLRGADLGGDAGKLWHPRHLSYLPLAYLLTKALSLMGGRLSHIFILQLMNVIFAFFTLFLFLVLVLKTVEKRIAGLLAGLGLAFSFGFWFYSVEPEVHVPETFYVLLGFYGLTIFTGPSRIHWSVRSFLMGLAGCLIVLGHVSGGLYLIGLGLGCLFFMNRDEFDTLPERFIKGLGPASIFSATSLGLALLVYLYAHDANPLARGQGLFEWIGGAFNPNTGMGYRHNYMSVSIYSPLLFFVGFFSDLVSNPFFVLERSWWADILKWLVAAGSITIAVTFFARLRSLMPRHGKTLFFIMVYVIPMAVFSSLWEPENLEIKVALLPFFWLCVALALDDYEGKGKLFLRACVCVTLLAMIVFNFYSSLLPWSDHSRNSNLARAAFVAEHTEPDAVIYVSGCDSVSGDKYYIPYFSIRQVRVMDFIMSMSKKNFPASAIDAFLADSGRPIYIESELTEPGPAVNFLADTHKVDPEKIIDFFSSLPLEKVADNGQGLGLYRLRLLVRKAEPALHPPNEKEPP